MSTNMIFVASTHLIVDVFDVRHMFVFDTDTKLTHVHSINSFCQINIGVDVAVPCLGYIKYNMFIGKNFTT